YWSRPADARRRMAATTGPSAASRVFIAFLAAVVASAALLGGILALEAQAAEREEAESLTLALARTIALSPDVVKGMSETDAGATGGLQPLAVDVMDSTPLDFVTIMRTDGTRITHPDPDQIGGTYLGTIADAAAGGTVTEEFTGTL